MSAQTAEVGSVIAHNSSGNGSGGEVAAGSLIVEGYKGIAVAVLRVVHLHKSEHHVAEVGKGVVGTGKKLAAVVGHRLHDERGDGRGVMWGSVCNCHEL